jgi:hypothetical protein
MSQNDPKSLHPDDALEALRKYAAERDKNQPYQGGGSCPSCGHCPHCGRGGRQAYPLYPQSPPWWTGNQWGGGLTNGSGSLPGVTGPHFVTGMTAQYGGGPGVDPNASWTLNDGH